MYGKNNGTAETEENVYGISNDLSRLICVGILNLYYENKGWSDLGGISVNYKYSKLDWKWLDLQFLDFPAGCEKNPVIRSLKFLIEHKFIVATYRKEKIEIGRPSYLPYYRVKVYAIPADIEGARFIKTWRQRLRKSQLVNRRMLELWKTLIAVLDFSGESWSSNRKKNSILDVSSSGMTLMNCVSNFGLINVNLLVSFHIERWKSNLPCKGILSHRLENIRSKINSIYASINSPQFPEDMLCCDHDHLVLIFPCPQKRLSSLLNDLKKGCLRMEGIDTDMYPFQMRSLCKMFEQETASRCAITPNLVHLTSQVDGKKFYLDLSTFDMFNKPEIYNLPKGGILAENMGLGKTLICLALICYTKCDVSSPPEDYLLYHENKINDAKAFGELSKLRSLKDMCKNHVNQKSLPWRYFLKYLPDSVVNDLIDSPAYFRLSLVESDFVNDIHESPRKFTRRKFTNTVKQVPEGTIYRTLYLCNTTLVIVPDNLLHQWHSETRKHVSETYLKKLFISKDFRQFTVTNNSSFSNEIITDPKILIKYDVVFLSSSILAKQIGKSERLKKWENPLSKVYWKRLIIDEGHSTSSKNSRLSMLWKDLHAERRWAVTGTPTAGLTKLHMNEEDNDINDVLSDRKKKYQYIIQNKFDEKEDLTKLGTIVSNFLRIEPFHSQPKLWFSLIVGPLVSSAYGASHNLSNLLNSIIVRHTPEQIEKDLELPQLHHEVVFLEPSYHNRLAINLFTAVLAVNAVSSERTDVDYMFHPSNRQQLRRLIINLQRATFHWTGFKQEDVESLVHICEACLRKKNSDGKAYYSDYDTLLLEKSMKIAAAALHNPQWRSLALLHEMHYFVSDLPYKLIKYFGVGITEGSEGTKVGIFGAPHLSKVQDIFYKNRFSTFKDEEEFENKISEISKQFWDWYWSDNVQKNHEKLKRLAPEQEKGTSIESFQVKKAIESDDKKSFRKSEVQKAEEIEHENSKGINFDHRYSKMLSLQNLRHATVLGTSSSKLSYLASRLLEDKIAGVKSIVFFEFEDSAYYLTELLDLIGVNYILYATFIDLSKRTTNLSEFANYDSDLNGGISLVMDLKLASHGLTIISATKVYFINPVWLRSVEAQAIKRAHRIGQRRDVFVETLILKGTLEEEVYRRRSAEIVNNSPSDEKQQQKKYLIDDSGMQDFILQHRFLEVEEGEPEYCPFSANSISSITQLHLNPLELAEYEIPHHSLVTTDENKSHWQMYLFNEGNLSNIQNLRSKKLRYNSMQNELISGKLESAVHGITKKRNSSPTNLKYTKRVRF